MCCVLLDGATNVAHVRRATYSRKQDHVLEIVLGYGGDARLAKMILNMDPFQKFQREFTL
jgi:hypothetical protein